MTDHARARRAERRVRWSVRLGMVVLRVLAMTWRMRVTNDGPWRAVRAGGGGFILSLWHGDLLPLAWAHRRERIVVMVSEHRDGEIIAQVLERLGYGTARGSTTRGGARALLGMIRAVQAGSVVGITPDGPRGPRHSVQPGVAAAARRAGVPIVAIAVAVSSAWRLRSWDRFVIPRPFARVSVAYSDPLVLDADADEATATGRVAAVMHEASAAAARAIGGTPS